MRFLSTKNEQKIFNGNHKLSALENKVFQKGELYMGRMKCRFLQTLQKSHSDINSISFTSSI